MLGMIVKEMTEETKAVSATRRQMRELVDGTIEVKFHIDPRCRDDFLRLFPEIDKPAAIAPLVADFEHKPKEKIGSLCLLAVQFCKNPTFWEWLGIDPEVYRNRPSVGEEVAKANILELLSETKIVSRKELDTNPEAARIFQEQIRQPFMRFLYERTNETPQSR